MATNQAENKPSRATEQAAAALAQLKAAVARLDWKEAEKAYETLRFGHCWTYARFAAEFGSERWEDIAAEMDDAESETDE
jgi:hypothetical protein